MAKKQYSNDDKKHPRKGGLPDLGLSPREKQELINRIQGDMDMAEADKE
jgi:hypothetical protein